MSAPNKRHGLEVLQSSCMGAVYACGIPRFCHTQHSNVMGVERQTTSLDGWNADYRTNTIILTKWGENGYLDSWHMLPGSAHTA